MVPESLDRDVVALRRIFSTCLFSCFLQRANHDSIDRQHGCVRLGSEACLQQIAAGVSGRPLVDLCNILLSTNDSKRYPLLPKFQNSLHPGDLLLWSKTAIAFHPYVTPCSCTDEEMCFLLSFVILFTLYVYMSFTWYWNFQYPLRAFYISSAFIPRLFHLFLSLFSLQLSVWIQN